MDVMEPELCTKYCSSVGKLMHMMQYSWPEIYNCIRDCARHMSAPGEKHMATMIRIMKYLVQCPKRGLVLEPKQKWDGKKDFQFVISGQSDSDYAICLDTHRSISGTREF